MRKFITVNWQSFEAQEDEVLLTAETIDEIKQEEVLDRPRASDVRIKQILEDEFLDKTSPMKDVCKIYLVDQEYKLPTVDNVKKLLAMDETDKTEYLSEFHDCDDFSFRLMGQISVPGWSSTAFGILFITTPQGGHAVNCFVDDKEQVWIVEPQNDKIFSKPDDWHAFFCLM
jgi:hypothetical protein